MTIARSTEQPQRLIMTAIQRIADEKRQTDEKYVYQELDTAYKTSLNLRNEERDEKDMTPLMLAAQTSHTGAIAWLLDKKKHPSLDVEIEEGLNSPHNKSALMYAADNNDNDSKVWSLLLDYRLSKLKREDLFEKFNLRESEHGIAINNKPFVNFFVVRIIQWLKDGDKIVQFLSSLIPSAAKLADFEILEKLIARYLSAVETCSQSIDVSGVVNEVVKAGRLDLAEKILASKNIFLKYNRDDASNKNFDNNFVASAIQLVQTGKADINRVKQFIFCSNSDYILYDSVFKFAVLLQDAELIKYLYMQRQKRCDNLNKWSFLSGLDWKNIQQLAELIISTGDTTTRYDHDLLAKVFTEFRYNYIEKASALKIAIALLRRKLDLSKHDIIDYASEIDDPDFLTTVLNYATPTARKEFILRVYYRDTPWKSPLLTDELIQTAKERNYFNKWLNSSDHTPITYVLNHLINKRMTAQDAETVLAKLTEIPISQNDLELAVETGVKSVVELLLDHRGVQLNIKQSKFGKLISPALTRAVMINNWDMILLLLRRGAICNHFAIEVARDPRIKLFLQAFKACKKSQKDRAKKLCSLLSEDEKDNLVHTMGESQNTVLESVLGKEFIQQAQQRKAEKVQTMEQVQIKPEEPSAPPLEQKSIPATISETQASAPDLVIPQTVFHADPTPAPIQEVKKTSPDIVSSSSQLKTEPKNTTVSTPEMGIKSIPAPESKEKIAVVSMPVTKSEPVIINTPALTAVIKSLPTAEEKKPPTVLAMPVIKSEPVIMDTPALTAVIKSIPTAEEEKPPTVVSMAVVKSELVKTAITVPVTEVNHLPDSKNEKSVISPSPTVNIESVKTTPSMPVKLTSETGNDEQPGSDQKNCTVDRSLSKASLFSSTKRVCHFAKILHDVSKHKDLWKEKEYDQLEIMLLQNIQEAATESLQLRRDPGSPGSF